MKKMLICLFAAVLAVSMMGCKGDVGSGSGEGGGSGYIGSKAPDEAKAVGDIVFSDGSATPYVAGLTLTDNQKSKSIAVIYKVDGDKVYGVGMAHKLGIKWCKDTANGLNYNFLGIQCTPLQESSGEISFSGDTDGSNNFTSIGEELGSGNDTNQEGMYPAFEFAKNYKDDEFSRVKGSIYEEGWYLPTISELYDIWKVKATVNAAYDLCKPYQPVNYKFGAYYWSSSQRALNSKYAYYMDFFSNGPAYYDKNTSADVCCIRVF